MTHCPRNGASTIFLGGCRLHGGDRAWNAGGGGSLVAQSGPTLCGLPGDASPGDLGATHSCCWMVRSDTFHTPYCIHPVLYQQQCSVCIAWRHTLKEKCAVCNREVDSSRKLGQVSFEMKWKGNRYFFEYQCPIGKYRGKETIWKFSCSLLKDIR